MLNICISRKYQSVPQYEKLCQLFFDTYFKMTQSSSIRILYKIIFSIRDYEGFEFVVDSFDLRGFEAVGFDSDLYFERFPEYNKANQNVMAFGPSYKNAYKWTSNWDDDHKDDDADI